MSDNQESAATGEENQPAPADNSNQAGQDNSGGLSVDALLPLLSDPKATEVLRSIFRSEKDRAVNRAEATATEAKDEVARLAQALGVDPAKVREAQDSLALQDMVQKYQSGQLIPQAQATNETGQGSSVDLAKARQSIIASTGLPETHPGIDDFIAEQDWSDPIAAAAKVTTWATEQKAAIKQPTASDTAPMSTGAAATTLSAMKVEEIGDELIELQRNPRANKDKIAEYIKELEGRDT